MLPPPISLREPFYHHESGTVRFWVLIEEAVIGASVGRLALHYRYCPEARDDDPLATYLSHASEVDEAVRLRWAEGALEPVMLREFDLRRVRRSP
ncbi:hypothetical protein RQP53_00535 [Paucibacter sp. APW11]|uniref:DUF1488 domain-containing protein n=1 Tax=Roseateles aquae TaxID=3077235 RepID=A0ABU3P6A9_9BURK|nr:hypothetical protein [Paucibacter sp. APW11]MDT8997755.1 hypothetical protein [Paucibacter sp. APW11]